RHIAPSTRRSIAPSVRSAPARASRSGRRCCSPGTPRRPRSDAGSGQWERRLLLEVAVQRRTADSVSTRDARLRDALGCLRAHLAALLGGEQSGATLVDAALLGGRDPLGLALADHRAFELGEGAHEVHLELRVRVFFGLGAEGESLIDELDAGALAGDPAGDLIEVDDGSGEPVHGGDDDVVPLADIVDQFLELPSAGEAIRAASLMVGEDAVALPHRLALPLGVLVDGRDSDVGDALPAVFHHA